MTRNRAARSKFVVGRATAAPDPTNDLDAIEALTGTGFACRIAADTWDLRDLLVSGDGLDLTFGGGVSGDPTFALADDAAALEALTGTGLANRTGSAAWELVTYESGTYTPTTFDTTNVTSSSAEVSNYARIGAVCRVHGLLHVDPASAGLATEVGIQFPIASALTSDRQCVGYGGNENGTVFAMVTGLSSAGTPRAKLRFEPAGGGSQDLFFNFSYRIV